MGTQTKHQNFEAGNIADYLKSYSQAVHDSLQKVDSRQLELAQKQITDAVYKKKRVFVAGNGGSAAISDHLCCDFTKGTTVHGQPNLRTQSLVANTAVLTALGNDFGYENTFSSQLEMLSEPGDLVILISSSGNSPNIVNAAKLARERGVGTLGLTGFDGGSVVSYLDVHLHVPINNYGVVEDCHQSLMHILAQFMLIEKMR